MIQRCSTNIEHSVESDDDTEALDKKEVISVSTIFVSLSLRLSRQIKTGFSIQN